MINLELNQLSKITTLDGEDIVSIVDKTLSSIEKDKTYLWPDNITTMQEKKDLFIANIKKNMNREGSFFFKRTYEGKIVSINGGYIWPSDGYFMYTTGLADTINGSQGWSFDPDVTPQQKQFLENNGFNGMYLQALPGKAAMNHVIGRYKKIGCYVHPPMDMGAVSVTKIDFNNK
jgi:hypothetical protein